jgi:hypothetical protein
MPLHVWPQSGDLHYFPASRNNNDHGESLKKRQDLHFDLRSSRLSQDFEIP